jgi:uncharacterized membrane protein YjjP (DUF1212 family)
MTKQEISTMLPYDYDDVLDTILDIGCRLLEAGAEVRRVEDTVERLCLAYGAHDVDVFSIVVLVGVTVEGPNGDHYTQIRKVGSIGNSLVRIEKLNALSRRLCACPEDPWEVKEEVKRICQKKTYSHFLMLLSAAIAAGGFAVFFGGSWTDGLVAAVIGVLIMVFTLYTPAKVNGTLKTFVTAFVAGVAALGACKFVPYTSPGEIMIGTIMLMIPGLALGTSLRDLFGGDMVSGLLRFVQALFTAAIIAAGYGLAWLTIGGVL